MGKTHYTGSLTPAKEGFGTGSIITIRNAYYTGSLMPSGGGEPTPTIPPTEPPTIPPSYEYEAYWITNNVMTSLGTITDLSKTFTPKDDSYYSTLFVYDGDVYEINTTPSAVKLDPTTYAYDEGSVVAIAGDKFEGNAQRASFIIQNNGKMLKSYSGKYTKSGSVYIDDHDVYPENWVNICGQKTSTAHYCFCVSTDGLYTCMGSASKISDITQWDKISGTFVTNQSQNAYGIANGKLYYLYGWDTGITQQGSDTTWSDISGAYTSTSQYGYGINNGALYALSTTQTQVGSDTTWTKISGYSKTGSGMFNRPVYALGINNGGLYSINATTATQIGSSTDWKSCSGFYNNTMCALAYDSSALYYISSSGATKLMDGEFVYCGGTYSNSGGTAVGVAIRKKV